MHDPANDIIREWLTKYTICGMRKARLLADTSTVAEVLSAEYSCDVEGRVNGSVRLKLGSDPLGTIIGFATFCHDWEPVP